jgi:RNA polymerase sigma-70 factor (ECF subfamily)
MMPSQPDLITHLPTLRRYALVLARNADAAEDLVQEALLRAMEGSHTWKPGREERPWLLSILHNVHVSRQRRRAVEAAVAQDAERAPPAAISAPQPEQVHFSQTMAALMQLPDEQREVLVLVAIEGLSYKDAADILGWPVGTLMSRLGRAREVLRAASGRDASASGQDASRPSLRVVR